MRCRTSDERRWRRSPASCDLPARRIEQAAQHLDGGRLAGAVGAEQPVDLAVADLQADVG